MRRVLLMAVVLFACDSRIPSQSPDFPPATSKADDAGSVVARGALLPDIPGEVATMAPAEAWTLDRIVDRCENPRRYDYAALINTYGDGFDGMKIERPIREGEVVERLLTRAETKGLSRDAVRPLLTALIGKRLLAG